MTADRAAPLWLRAAVAPEWPADWATRVSATAKQLRKQGHRAEEAWRMAADLHRPTGAVPDPAEIPRAPDPRARGTARRILLYLLDQPGPVTVAQICGALDLGKKAVRLNLPRVAVQSGVVMGLRGVPASLWRAR